MSYIISNTTLAIVPNNQNTRIIEMKHEKKLKELTIKIIEENCNLNGSTLKGRIKGSSYLIGSNYKPPIVVNESNNIILVPTHSVRNEKCNWINLKTILHYWPLNDNKVKIEFINNKKIILDISYNIFDKQVMRAIRLSSAIKGRNY